MPGQVLLCFADCVDLISGVQPLLYLCFSVKTGAWIMPHFTYTVLLQEQNIDSDLKQVSWCSPGTPLTSKVVVICISLLNRVLPND